MLNKKFWFDCLAWLAIVHSAYIAKTAFEDSQFAIGMIFSMLSSLTYIYANDIFDLITGTSQEEDEIY